MEAVRFPGESSAYRSAREELLQAERELRRHVEAVAAARRKLPLGGVAPEDYLFEEGGRNLEDTSPPHSVRLSELFAPGKDTLVLYNFMFSLGMEQACRMCSALIDGLNGNARHIEQRANLAIVASLPSSASGPSHAPGPGPTSASFPRRRTTSTATTLERPRTARKTQSSTPSSSAAGRCTTSTARSLPSCRAMRAKTSATSTSCGRCGMSWT